MKKFLLFFVPGLLTGMLLFIGGAKAVKHTSESEYCASCHIHPQATTSWKQSVHYITRSGDRAQCIECHLPPKGEGHLPEKVKTGARDIWGKWTKDPDSFDWDERSRLEIARSYVPESACLHCHETLFTSELSREGEEAHLYYDQAEKTDDLHCINCHLNAGHYIEGYTHGGNLDFGSGRAKEMDLYTEPEEVREHKSFTEKIPGSRVSFNMIAIPGGKFMMGSPEDEPFRQDDEGPRVEVELNPFYMGEIEVSWDEYLAFYSQTSAEGRSTDTEKMRVDVAADAISGATPPYGQPDQNWGLGQRPAISISYHAAETYCLWLSKLTGKTYRLPTEAEWEYACRAGSEMPYFFEGDPEKFERSGLIARFRKNDTSLINSYIVYQENSPSKTQEPGFVKPNPFGLRNMLGNVAEYCSDLYHEDAYSLLASQYGEPLINPVFDKEGNEHVIRGGSFRDNAGNLRSAARDYTRTDQWLRTDPQIPKSIWWYSDCFHVGFRVLCEFDENTGNTDL
ncbi:MAG: SUMF1/EgtB/PvdO family nonheme iron enzyme [Marinilabiliaceae bacterium]|jgi:formylglycine-generating enzyme required for sulfatase activity/nitrate/TMAO reductase-like tetraheme cytochrome c subunit|nr:SUMF1/EgtB/PvdO family nonheme iron enzyme [Marinilabiliaceae bacterium]